MRVLYRHSIEVICAIPGNPKSIQGILRNRESYDERVAKCFFCSNEPTTTEILLADDDKLYYFLFQNVIYHAVCNSGCESDLLAVIQKLLRSLKIEYYPVDPHIMDVTKKNDDEVSRLFEVMTGLLPLPDPSNVSRLNERIERVPSCCFPKRASSFYDSVFFCSDNEK